MLKILPPPHCPGLYCGTTLLADGNWSACGACARGFRRNYTSSMLSTCIQCLSEPTFYDWLYMGFMALLPLTLHWISIDMAVKRRRYRPCEAVVHDKQCFTRGVLILHFSALVETVAAAILTVLIVEPRWTFKIYSCHVQSISDWYTMLHNPSPGYDQMLHCTHEAVYPLYTIMLIYYAFCLCMLLLIRPILASKFLPVRGKTSIYAAMYFLPGLAVLHAVAGGLLYYSFPYITMILSVISSAAHFAFQLDQSMKSLIFTTVLDIRNLVILVLHWALHAYGIIAITELRNVPFHAGLIALAPLPAIFYVLTARFTDPNKLHFE